MFFGHKLNQILSCVLIVINSFQLWKSASLIKWIKISKSCFLNDFAKVRLIKQTFELDPNWHEGWYFYLLALFGSDFVSWIFIKNSTIDSNRVNLTPCHCQAHWVLKVASKMSIFLAFIAHANEGYSLFSQFLNSRYLTFSRTYCSL